MLLGSLKWLSNRHLAEKFRLIGRGTGRAKALNFAPCPHEVGEVPAHGSWHGTQLTDQSRSARLTPFLFPLLSMEPPPARGSLQGCDPDRTREERVKWRLRQSRNIGPLLCGSAPLSPAGLLGSSSHQSFALRFSQTASRREAPTGNWLGDNTIWTA